MVNLDRRVFNEDLSYSQFDEVIKVNSVKELSEFSLLHGKKVLLEVKSTVGMTSDFAKSIPDNMEIRVTGGYTRDYLEGMKSADLSKIYSKATYNKSEIVDILESLERVEQGIDNNWTDLEKSLYIYEYMKKNILYRKPRDVEGISGIGIYNRGKNWDSLTGIVDKVSTCNGFSLIYQELLTRQEIKCVHVGGYYKDDKTEVKEGEHAWNVVIIDNNPFLVDIIWDAIDFENGIDKVTGFGTTNNNFYRFKNNKDLKDKLLCIDKKWIDSTLKMFGDETKIQK